MLFAAMIFVGRKLRPVDKLGFAPCSWRSLLAVLCRCHFLPAADCSGHHRSLLSLWFQARWGLWSPYVCQPGVTHIGLPLPLPLPLPGSLAATSLLVCMASGGHTTQALGQRGLRGS